MSPNPLASLISKFSILERRFAGLEHLALTQIEESKESVKQSQAMMADLERRMMIYTNPYVVTEVKNDHIVDNLDVIIRAGGSLTITMPPLDEIGRVVTIVCEGNVAIQGNLSVGNMVAVDGDVVSFMATTSGWSIVYDNFRHLLKLYEWIGEEKVSAKPVPFGNWRPFISGLTRVGPEVQYLLRKSGTIIFNFQAYLKYDNMETLVFFIDRDASTHVIDFATVNVPAWLGMSSTVTFSFTIGVLGPGLHSFKFYIGTLGAVAFDVTFNPASYNFGLSTGSFITAFEEWSV
jgi:hypothetical protein